MLSSRARPPAPGSVPSILQRCHPGTMSPRPGPAFAPTDPREASFPPATAQGGERLGRLPVERCVSG